MRDNRKKLSVFQHTTFWTISVFHSSKFVLLKLPLITEKKINYLAAIPQYIGRLKEKLLLTNFYVRNVGLMVMEV